MKFLLNLENFYNLGTDYFSFTNQKCIFELKENDNSKITSKNILIATPNTEEKLYYSFSGKNGLCLTTEYGSVQEKNIFGKFVSLSSNNAKALLQFLQEYGYFFKLPANQETIIDFNNLIELTYRIRATMLLMNSLENKTINYEKVLHYTLYLILGHPVEMPITDKQKYISYKSNALNLINSAIPSNNDVTITIDGDEYYSIADMIHNGNYNLRADEYEDISTNENFMFSYPGINDPLYRQLTIAYKDCHTCSKTDRLIIEFLFHLMHENGVIKNISFENELEFYSSSSLNLNEKLKSVLLIVSKIILSQEINYNVSKIKAIYNPATLQPTWKSPNLLTALYFSLFYMRPNSEIYRKCANPSCNNFFLVKTSNSRKKYCCSNCRNASNQRDHRSRQKNNQG